MDGDQESPTSSPAPNQQHPAPVEELGDEAEAFPTPAPLELPHPYRYLSPEPSPAPSHSGLEGDYDLIDSHPEASLSFTRQFDVLSSAVTSASSTCPSSSSASLSLPSSHHNSLPGPSHSHRPHGPGPSDPVFSAHSHSSGLQPAELLPFASNNHPEPSWDVRPDLPISSSWGGDGPAAEPSDWDRSHLGPPAGWSRSGEWEPASLGPGPSGLDQAVPEQLNLEREEDQDGLNRGEDLEWGASSSGLQPQHIDYSDENSLESEVQQNFSRYSSVEATGLSPQPSSSASAVSGSMFGPPLSPVNPNLSSVTFSTSGSSTSGSSQPAPAPSNGSGNDAQQGEEASSGEPEEIPTDNNQAGQSLPFRVTSAKRSISFPDSPMAPEPAKRPRRHLDDVRPDSPSEPQTGQSFSSDSHSNMFMQQPGPSYSHESMRGRRTRRGVRTLNADIQDLGSPSAADVPSMQFSSSSRPRVADSVPTHEVISIDIPESVPGTSGSISSQIRAEIENCLRDGGPDQAEPLPNSSQEVESGLHFERVDSMQDRDRMPDCLRDGGASIVQMVDECDSHTAGPNNHLLPNTSQPYAISLDPNSPTGSDLMMAGPSHNNPELQHRDNSPSGSDADGAGPSQAVIGHVAALVGAPHSPNVRPGAPAAEPGPNSPTPSDHPSESDAEEAGPSQRPRFYHGPSAVGGGGGYHGPQEREAAPVRRTLSPPLARRRRNVVEHCAISSSTGPVDSNPPTPEMFHHGGDIDNDISLPSPPRMHHLNAQDEEAVVDSTVDSTSNLPFLLNSPSDYRGSEAEAEGDSSDGDEADDASIAGSEASSTTNASLGDQALSFPGQDDNEGISTSGQVDDGRFRLVPNDMEFPFSMRPLPSGSSIQNVPDMEVPSPAEDEPEEQSREAGSKPVFKKPYNRKGRLLDSYPFPDDNEAGPSGVNPNQASSYPDHPAGHSSFLSGPEEAGPSHMIHHHSSGETDAREMSRAARQVISSSNFSSAVTDTRPTYFSSGVTDARRGTTARELSAEPCRVPLNGQFSSNTLPPTRSSLQPASGTNEAQENANNLPFNNHQSTSSSSLSLGIARHAPSDPSESSSAAGSSSRSEAREGSSSTNKSFQAVKSTAAKKQSLHRAQTNAATLNFLPNIPPSVSSSPHFSSGVTDALVSTRPISSSHGSRLHNNEQPVQALRSQPSTEAVTHQMHSAVNRLSGQQTQSISSAAMSTLGLPEVSTPRFSVYSTSQDPRQASRYAGNDQRIFSSSGTTDARYLRSQLEGNRMNEVSSSGSTSITMSILTSGSSSRSSSAYSAVSLFPVQPRSDGRAGTSRSQNNSLVHNSSHFSESSLGLGVAFSGLPSSISQPPVSKEDNESDQQGQGSHISGPLSKRLRTRHYQEQAKASQGEGNHERGEERPKPVETARLPGVGSEILRNSLEGKARSHGQLPRSGALPELPHNNNQSLASLMAAPPLVENVLINMETGRLEPEEPAQEQSPSVAAPAAGTSQEPVGVLFLGGTQQTYSLNLESSSLSVAALKPNQHLQAKSAAEDEQHSWIEGGGERFIRPATSILKTELEAKTQKGASSPYTSPKKRPVELIESQNVEHHAECLPEPEPEKIARDVEEEQDEVHNEILPSLPDEGELLEQVQLDPGTTSSTGPTLTIGDAPVASRAVASLPLEYLALRQLEGGQQGVVVQRTVPLNCRFGPMEGRLVDAAEGLDTSFPLCLISQGHRLDVSSEDESNWMRFIRPAQNEEEQNMIMTEVNGNLFFVTNRVVNFGEELKVWYSEQYATQHGLSKVPVAVPSGEEKPGPPKKNVDRHKNTRSFAVNVARENIAEKTHEGSGSPNYTCDICGRKFERQASLARHLALHKGDKSYSCPDCGQKFSHTFNLERHRKKVHHSDPSGQHVRCSNCGTWFPSSMVLKVHMFSHHPNKEEQNWTVEDAMAQSGKENSEQGVEEMKFQCPSDGCGSQYDTWLQLVEHAGDHGTPCLPFDNPDLLAAGPVHKCELCYKTFASDARLKKHMAVHAGDDTKPLECETCGKRFLTNSALAGHIKTHIHPDTLYDCPICLQEFEQVSSLKEHVYIHKEGGHFTCPHCQKTFTEYPNIRKHIRSFHAEKRYACTSCEKSFTGKDKLKIHMVKHTEAKEFMCDDCGKQFKRKDKMREHVKRMHTSGGARKEKVAVSDQASDKFTPKVSRHTLCLG